MAANNMNAALGFLHVVFGSEDASDVERLITLYEKETIFTTEEAREVRDKIRELGGVPLGIVIEDVDKHDKACEFRDYILKICE